METTINLSQWVETYTSDLYSWAFHKVSDSELAKDLVQDTFLAAAEKSASFIKSTALQKPSGLAFSTTKLLIITAIK